MLLSLPGRECDFRHRREPLTPLCSSISPCWFFEHLLGKGFSESLPRGRTQIPRAPWSRQPPAASLELVSELTSRVFHLCLLPSPQTRPGLSLETGMEREKSICGL